MSDSQKIQALKALFQAHQTHCSRCVGHEDGATGDLWRLCYQGMLQFKAILDAVEPTTKKSKQETKWLTP